MDHRHQSYRRNLPHLRAEGSIYFVTWRLHAAQSDLTPDERDVMMSALCHFEGDRYELLSFVVMNDHVHVLVWPHRGHRLEALVGSWKSFTSKVMVRDHRRRPPVWQSEYHDRIVRHRGELHRKLAYIANNPVKRWPEIGSYRWMRPS